MTEHIAIVGGGTGGTVLANTLVEKLDAELAAGEVEITLFNDSGDHVYKPVWLYVAFGQREPADGRRPLREVVDNRVTIRQDYVVDVDHERKELELSTLSTLRRTTNLSSRQGHSSNQSGFRASPRAGTTSTAKTVPKLSVTNSWK